MSILFLSCWLITNWSSNSLLCWATLAERSWQVDPWKFILNELLFLTHMTTIIFLNRIFMNTALTSNSVTDTTPSRKQVMINNMVRNCIFAIVITAQVQVDTWWIILCPCLENKTNVTPSLILAKTRCSGSNELPTRPYLVKLTV